MRRFLLPLLLLASPVLAAEPAANSPPDAPKGGRPGTNVDLEFLMAPLTGANGKLIGYAYINPRLTVMSEGFAAPVREKGAFLQDAFVREINSKGVATAGNPQKIDIAGVEARLLANANKIMGPGKVRMITICTVQIAELRPTQTPSPTPADALHDVDAHGNPLKSRCEAAKPA